MFLNIAENSIKFNLNQHKLITVKHLSAIGYLKLCITDNGIGIDNQYNEKIFRIFQKLHNHTEYPGSGIGLAICKKIIENHNGQIWLESELGKGTKFYFSIPIVT